MRHDFPLGGLEQPTPSHVDVFQGRGKESQAEGRGGILHRRGSNLPGLWMDTGGGVVFKIPWESLEHAWK